MRFHRLGKGRGIYAVEVDGDLVGWVKRREAGWQACPRIRRRVTYIVSVYHPTRRQAAEATYKAWLDYELDGVR